MIGNTLPTSAEHQERTPTEEEIVLRWWRETIGEKTAPSGPRAELRRARTIEEVVFAPLYHDLRHRLRDTRWRSVDRLALVAGVLAQVREDDGSRKFVEQMAAPVDGSKNHPRIAPSRFRRILRLGDEDRDELFQQVRRVITQVAGRANAADLAKSLYWWSTKIRKQWALDYYEHVDERALKND